MSVTKLSLHNYQYVVVVYLILFEKITPFVSVFSTSRFPSFRFFDTNTVSIANKRTRACCHRTNSILISSHLHKVVLSGILPTFRPSSSPFFFLILNGWCSPLFSSYFFRGLPDTLTSGVFASWDVKTFPRCRFGPNYTTNSNPPSTHLVVTSILLTPA